MIEFPKEVSEEQVKQLKKVRNKALLKSALLTVKFVSINFLSNILALSLDHFYVHSPVFAGLSVFVNTIMSIGIFQYDMQKLEAYIAEEVKKILKK